MANQTTEQQAAMRGKTLALLSEIAAAIQTDPDRKIELIFSFDALRLEFWNYTPDHKDVQHLSVNSRMTENEFEARRAAILDNIATGAALPDETLEISKLKPATL